MSNNNRNRDRSNGAQQRSGNPAVRNSNPFEDAPEVIKLETSAVPDEREYLTIFSIDGKDYDLWINPPANLGLRYLKMARLQGEMVAQQWAMEQMLGEDGYDALMDYEGLTEEQLTKIGKGVEKYMLGNKEAGKRGNR